jgi:hypothetical protein
MVKFRNLRDIFFVMGMDRRSFHVPGFGGTQAEKIEGWKVGILAFRRCRGARREEGGGGAMVKGARSGGAPDGCALTERWNMLILG